MSIPPECPYCNTPLAEDIPSSLQGSINVRCPSCGLLYGYSKELGSYPLEDELDYQLSPGFFKKKISIGQREDPQGLSLASKDRVCFYFCIISPILVLVLLLVVSFLLSLVNS